MALRARRGPGRPKRSKAEKQGARVLLTFTEDEYAMLRQAAGGTALGTYARELVLRALKRRK